MRFRSPAAAVERTARPASGPAPGGALWSGEESPGRRPAGMPHNTAIHAAHVARYLADTLRDRPLSEANTPYVVDSLRSLRVLRRRLLAAVPHLSPAHRDGGRTLARLLGETVRRPSVERIEGLSRFIRDEFALYARLFAAPVAARPLPPDVFRRRSYSHVVVMIGAGIGIGDEIKLVPFFRRLRGALRVPAACFEIHSFSPAIWTTLTPELTVTGLVDDPLAAFDRLRELRARTARGRVLSAFACFMRQESLRCLLPLRHLHDGLEVALASGEVKVQLRGDPAVYQTCRLDPDDPCLSRALAALGDHLAPRTAGAVPPASGYRARAGASYRIVVNPFTSKHSPLAPGDWASFVACVRRGLPPGRRIECAIVPGLTPSCHAYAREIERLCRQGPSAGGEVRLVADDVAGFTPANALERVYDELTGADLLLGIDTYTAHLAVYARVVSIALCLNRNVSFWDPAPSTFWLDIGQGYRAVATMIRGIARLMTVGAGQGGPFDQFIASSRDLLAAGDPAAPSAGERDRQRLGRWVRLAERAWNGLPAPVARALTRFDADHSWPTVRGALTAAAGDPARRALARTSRSCFYRLASLAAATATSRGVAR